MKFVKKYWGVLRDAFKAFTEDNAIKLSAALSYYTIFSIGPMLVIAMSLAGFVYGKEAVQGKLFGQLRGLLGTEAAAQVQSIIQNIQQTESGLLGTIIGGIILLIGATGIFVEIQDSINYIWSLKAKPKRGFVKLLFNRLLSFSLIISVGFLLLVSLVINTAMDVLNEHLFRMFPDTTVVLFYILNTVILVAVISVLFAIIFKVLPDGKIKWKDAFVGAIFTSILFILGKTAIGFYLGNSSLGVTYGTAAAVIIILTWVYYTSIILYFGAEFTKVYALDYGGGIVPHHTAVFIIKQESKEIQTRRKHPMETEKAAKERIERNGDDEDKAK
jgi:membrane protein